MAKPSKRGVTAGAVIIVLSQLDRIDRIIGHWSNYEFIRGKFAQWGTPTMSEVLSAWWFQLSLIGVGLAVIYLSVTQRSRVTRNADGEDIFVPRGLAAQVADYQRELYGNGDAFNVVRADGGVETYTRRRVDGLSTVQRTALFERDHPEIEKWWRGLNRKSKTWDRFRLPGGIWLSRDDYDALEESKKWELHHGVPFAADWYTTAKTF